MKDTCYIAKKRSHTVFDDISHELIEDTSLLSNTRTLIYERHGPRTLTHESSTLWRHQSTLEYKYSNMKGKIHELSYMKDICHQLFEDTSPLRIHHSHMKKMSHELSHLKDMGHKLFEDTSPLSNKTTLIWKTWVTNSRIWKTLVTNSSKTQVHFRIHGLSCMKNMSHELSHMKDTSHKLFKSPVSGSYHIGKKRSHRLYDDISHELFEDRTLIYERKQPRTLTYERHESQTIEDTSHELLNTRHTVPTNESRHVWVSHVTQACCIFREIGERCGSQSPQDTSHELWIPLSTRLSRMKDMSHELSEDTSHELFEDMRHDPFQDTIWDTSFVCDMNWRKTWATNSLKIRVTNSLRTCVTIPFKTRSATTPFKTLCEIIRMWYKSAKDMSHELFEDTSHRLFGDLDPRFEHSYVVYEWIMSHIRDMSHELFEDMNHQFFENVLNELSMPLSTRVSRMHDMSHELFEDMNHQFFQNMFNELSIPLSTRVSVWMTDI